MTRVMVLGASGMLGHKLLSVLSDCFEVVGTVRDSAAIEATALFAKHQWIHGVDASRFETVEKALLEWKPDVVLNAIGAVKQIDDGKSPVACIRLNALFPHQVAVVCGKIDARFITFSTDCVFSGRHGPYSITDVPDAEDVYGRSKLLGEVAGEGALTIRSSIIGRELKTQHSLVEWFISQRGRQARGFTRALYTGLTTGAMARLVGQLISSHPGLSGVWQVASEEITKYDLLQLVNEAFGLGVDLVRDEAFFCDRRLDGRAFLEQTGLEIPSWPVMISDLARDTRESV